jgi:peptide/nickel transport system permease protein
MTSAAEPPVLELDQPTAEYGRQPLVRRFLSSPAGWLGGSLTLLVILMAVLAPLIATYDPLEQNLTVDGILQPPNRTHLLGTDELGRDVFSRIVYGSRTSLVVAVSSVGIGVLLGIILGTTAGTGPGWWSFSIMRSIDALLAFPLLVLAIAISVALGRGTNGLILAIAVVNIPVFTRLSRAQTLQIMERQFITANVAMGASTGYIIIRHVVPNLLNAIIVQATLAISFAIIIESGLSFLGLGVQAPAPSWGVMIASGKIYMIKAPHMMLMPAAALFLTVLGLNLMGDALSDALDPRMFSK